MLVEGESFLTYRIGGKKGSIIVRQWGKRLPCVFWSSAFRRIVFSGLCARQTNSLLLRATQAGPKQARADEGDQQVGNSKDNGVSGSQGYLCHNLEVSGLAPSRGRGDVSGLF